MRPQPNRLPADAARGFAGAQIDRDRPLRFRLDGREVSGFAGDTILSAALASGIDTLGRHGDTPVGLTSRSAPAVSHASLSGDPQRALPMARTPALDGAEIVTLGGKRIGALARLFQPGRTLGLPLEQAHVLDQPWRAVPGAPSATTDLVVIGGGVAGLSAALAAARAGLAVTLIEAGARLGGHSGLFGTQDGEDSPEESMARLSADIAANAAINVMVCTRAFAVRSGLVRAHRVEIVNGAAHGSVIDIATRQIIIATGALERLPIFAGNRLPGVIGTLDAYELASRFGVWAGRNALVATSSNPAYRLAMLASDAGIAIDRIFDTRPHPASRFIEFSRAYGMVQSPGTGPVAVTIAKAGGAIAVEIDRPETEPISSERLLACGGWQPDLTLWHVAGGKSQWHGLHHRLEAVGQLDSIVLAGSAAGQLSRRGCIQGGADAVDQLLGRTRRPIDDLVIDPLYETPDAATYVAAPRDGAAPTFLDAGRQLLPRPAPPRRRWPLPFRRPLAQGLTSLSEAPQPLAICDVAAGVDLGLIPPDAAGVVAQERVALVPLALPSPAPDGTDKAPIRPEDVPTYLAGRFGADARVVRLTPDEERSLETGSLLYRSSDIDQPLLAIGVVLRPADRGAIALVAKHAIRTGLPVSVRDRGRAIPAKLEVLEEA
ncbi:MAG: hypothetical protein ABS75_04850 [Pelagibacterium sp. SCN 63-23]|nr:MAG: hypothetical protein ABS75_04850 [Pelagibacterium sp. SCN 63-23]